MLIPEPKLDQWSDFWHGNSVGTGNQFCCCKARKCERSLQTSPVWRGPNTADSADYYMTGYSPAALSASSFSRSVAHLNSETLPTHSWKCGRATGAQFNTCSLDRLQSPGFHWTVINGMSRSSTFREGQSSWVHSCNILSIFYPVRGVAWFY